MSIPYTKDLMANEIALLGYKIGDYSYGRPEVYDFASGKRVNIGRFFSFASGVKVLLGGNHRTDWVSTYPFSAIPDRWPEASEIEGHPHSNGDVSIGNDVCCGYNSSIMSGVSIGNGSVLAAFSVITKMSPLTQL